MCLLLSSDKTTYGSGPGKMVLRRHGSAWCLRTDLSLLQRQSTSQEKHDGSA